MQRKVVRFHSLLSLKLSGLALVNLGEKVVPPETLVTVQFLKDLKPKRRLMVYMCSQGSVKQPFVLTNDDV